MDRSAGGASTVVALALSLAATAVAREATPPVPGQVVINEIMYHPPLDLEELQYIELFNRGEEEADLSGWSFARGVRFVFPAGTRIAPGGFLVVCRDRDAFSARYGPEIPATGDFQGQLSHSRERLVLTDASGRQVDSVRYSDEGRWPGGPDGCSSSLERICPSAASQDPDNWAPSVLPEREAPAGTPGRRNDSHAANLPPVITGVEQRPRCPKPEQEVAVSARISDADGVAAAVLVYTVVSPGKESEAVEITMARVWGDERRGAYEATIPGQPGGHLVRYRIRTSDRTGVQRLAPPVNEPCPTYSYYSYANRERATIPLGFIIHPGDVQPPQRRRLGGFRFPPAASGPEPTRGNGAFVYVPAGGNEYQVFDHVRIPPRRGGYKIRFHKGQTLRGMSVVNLIFEDRPRFVLAEPLAYDLYHRAGVPAALSEHLRLHVDGRFLGYHLLVEQPNKAFLRRNGRDTGGNLYKLLWYGRGVSGKHEKKTNVQGGHDDLVAVIEGLERTEGEEEWRFIQECFNVEEFVNYFAVNMCISNWDGFFNNYFVYHDTDDTGRWEIYPWDEDKTWGDYDGAPPDYSFYNLPLSFGMDGTPARAWRGRGGPFGGGASWWRPAGYFSGPLLANPSFRRRFLERLEEVCRTLFTPESFFPVIDTMERRLEPEVRLRAETLGEDPEQAVRTFREYMESFRRHVTHRRAFILAQPELKRS